MSKKIGSKLAESLRLRRSSPPGKSARPEATPTLSTPPARKATVAAERPVQRAAQEPPASLGVLHPSRIWPD
ncbi:MAG: hypothetical protein ACYC7B_12630 [Burkholderiales bacterium]